MDALKKCIEAIEGYEKELGMTKTPLAKAGRAELAALEAVAEAASYAIESHAVDVRCREGQAVIYALDKLDALKEAGR